MIFSFFLQLIQDVAIDFQLYQDVERRNAPAFLLRPPGEADFEEGLFVIARSQRFGPTSCLLQQVALFFLAGPSPGHCSRILLLFLRLCPA
ncbi:hypothetical protein D3C72_2280740 [compost metagenome]